MAINYIVKECKDPKTPELEGNYYARTVTKGLVATRDLAARVALRSGHSRGAVMGVVEDTLEAMAHYMSLGYNVDFGKLGRFQLKLNSEGAASADEAHTGLIKKKYVHFQGKTSNYLGIAQFELVKNLNPKPIV